MGPINGRVRHKATKAQKNRNRKAAEEAVKLNGKA
jgi:hypothetical protein